MPDLDDEKAGSAGNQDEFFEMGMEALHEKRYADAVHYLQLAVDGQRSPEYLSQLALAVAHEKHDIKAAVALCQEAIRMDPRNPELFLRLGIVYLIADNRRDAIRIFRLGLRVGKSPAINRWLQILGHRQPPPAPTPSTATSANCAGKWAEGTDRGSRPKESLNIFTVR
jgi:tetratricopeptide (TPR) repeat protein